MGRPSKFTESMCDRVIELGKTGAGRAEMASDIGISRETWNDWLDKESPRFNEAFSDAVKVALYESQAWWERKGREATFDSKDFSATSYIFQMKNRFKDDWADRTEHRHAGPNGEDLPAALDSNADARMVAFMLGRAIGRQEKAADEKIDS